MSNGKSSGRPVARTISSELGATPKRVVRKKAGAGVSPASEPTPTDRSPAAVKRTIVKKRAAPPAEERADEIPRTVKDPGVGTAAKAGGTDTSITEEQIRALMERDEPSARPVLIPPPPTGSRKRRTQ